MDSAFAWVGLTVGIFGVAAVITGGLVVIRSKISGVTIDLLNQHVAAQAKRIDMLESEKVEAAAKIAALEAVKVELFGQVKSTPAFGEIKQSIMALQRATERQTQLLERLFTDLTGKNWKPGDPDRRVGEPR